MNIKGNNKIFVYYDDIIKSPDIQIIEYLKKEKVKEIMSKTIDYTKFEYMDINNIIRLLIQRTEKNILKYFAYDSMKTENFDKLYSTIYDNINHKYTISPPLTIVQTLTLSLSTNFISDVYIYSKNSDSDILTDISVLFNSNSSKVKYIYGSLESFLSNVEIDLFIVPSTDIICKICSLGKLDMKEVLLGNYGYNYDIVDDKLVLKNDILSLISKHFFHIKTFYPYQMTEDNLTQEYNNVMDNNLSLG